MYIYKAPRTGPRQRSAYSFKYLTDLLAIRCTFVKCGAVNLCIYIYIYVVIVIGVLGFGYNRSPLNIYYCK